MEAAVTTQAAFAAVLAAPAPGRGVGDDQLVAEAEAWEAIGRIADARRVVVAAEVSWRSHPQLSASSLAVRMGEKNDIELLTRLLRIGPAEASRRVRLGTPLLPRISLTGEDLPARFPAIAAAVQAGEVGLESARIVVDTLKAVHRRADPEALDAGDAQLTAQAAVDQPELMKTHATVWQLAMDPDGPEPSEAEQRRQREYRLSRPGADGLSTLRLRLPAEETALVRAGMNAHRRGVQFVHGETDAAPETGDEDVSCWHEADFDERTRPQYDFDAFMGIFRAGLRAEQDGSGDSVKVPHEVIVHATVNDLERHKGAGWADDVLVPFSIPTVERLQCSGGTRLLVTGGEGEPLYLGRPVRLFTAAQKKAIAARDGGCAWPGCSAPVSWSEAHHVAWYARDGGVTEVENGVLLCSFHHHLTHTTDKWKILIHERNPYLVPAHWHGPPLPRHRMQRHPIVQLNRPPNRRM